MKTFFIALAGLFISSAALADQPAPSKIETTYSFLKEAVEFKKFHTEIHTDISTGVHIDFLRTQIVTDVSRNNEELRFTLSWSITQNNFDRLPDGTLSASPVNKDRIGTTLCRVSESKATGEITGICSAQSNSIVHSGGAGDTVKLSLVDGRLTFLRLTALYFDMFAQDNTYLPARNRVTTTVLKNADGKTVWVEESADWRVNPETLEPTTPENTLPVTTVIAD